NKTLCDILGYNEAELRDLTFQEITHPDDLPADLIETEKLRNGTLATFSMEKRYVRKDGSDVWVNLTVSGVRDASGKFDYFILVIEDISKRKQVEEALQDSQRDLALALQSSRTAMFDWDVAQKRGQWNSQMAAI
ncbi:MAG: PAS domain S-box protein, partial [Candidatus Sulfotelmatobacter sp.]